MIQTVAFAVKMHSIPKKSTFFRFIPEKLHCLIHVND